MYKFDFEIRNDGLLREVLSRRSLSLDINVWIDLAEETGGEAKRVKRLLRDLVARGEVFCPLSFPLISELCKQNYESALRVAELMEELSLNVSFLVSKEIYKREIKNFLHSFFENKQPSLSKSDIYVPVMAYLSPVGALDFPQGFPDTMDGMKKFTDEITEKLSAMTLTDYVRLFRPLLPLPVEQFASLLNYSEVWKERFEFTKGNKEKMRRVEEEFVAKNLLLPVLKEERAKLPVEQQARFVAYVTSLPKDKYGGASGTIIDQLPALKTNIEVMTVTGYDPNRKGSMNDLFDIEMMIIPLAYGDVLVSRDKWIRDLITNRSPVLRGTSARYLSSMSEFEDYLKGI